MPVHPDKNHARMEINMKQLILSGVFLFITGIAYADCNPDYCANVYIDRLYIDHKGDVFIGTSGDETQLTCEASSGLYLTLPNTHQGADKIYSTLLAAQIAGKKFTTIQVNNTEPGCIIQYVTLDRQ